MEEKSNLGDANGIQKRQVDNGHICIESSDSKEQADGR